MNMNSKANDVDDKMENIEGRMVELHKETSDSLKNQNSSNVDTNADVDVDASDNNLNSSTSSVEKHLQRQQQLFDDLSSFFNSDDATPDEVKPLLSYIMNQVLDDMMQCRNDGITRFQTRRDSNEKEKDNMVSEDVISNNSYKILDVGCGVGALFPFYLEQAKKLDMNLNILGMDLSSKMITCAEENANALLEETNTKDIHSFKFENGDFVQRVLGDGYSATSDNGDSDENIQKHRGQYDAVVINACFGNFYDPGKVFYCFVSYFSFSIGSFVICT